MAIQRQKKTAIQGRQGVDYDVYKLPEAPNQSFLRSEFVEISSVSGKITVCADDAVLIAGLALEDASGVTDNEILVAVPKPGCKFISSVFHSTDASAITAITQRGTRFGLQVDSNKHYIDIEDTSNLAFLATRIVLPAGHSIGDQFGLLEFEILDEVNELSGRDNA